MLQLNDIQYTCVYMNKWIYVHVYVHVVFIVKTITLTSDVSGTLFLPKVIGTTLSVSLNETCRPANSLSGPGMYSSCDDSSPYKIRNWGIEFECEIIKLTTFSVHLVYI